MDQYSSDGYLMDWETAETHLYSAQQIYKDIGWVGSFALATTINPLIKRFEAGERTEKLYDEILAID